MENKKYSGAEVVVDSLINQDVEYVFAIPGAKIDAVFDELVDKGPEVILCRHEQNAAFMAQAVGRLTQKPGVVLVTSGPGVSNLATGLITATSEGDPVVAIGGQVKRSDILKQTHQSMDNVGLLKAVSKLAVEIAHPDNIGEAMANCFRIANKAKKGASFISLPSDVLTEKTKIGAIKPLKMPKLGVASLENIDQLEQLIKQAKLPVLLLGMSASEKEVTAVIRKLVAKMKIPVVEMFQAAGVISRELEHYFYGRIGLFRNQPGDRLLQKADLIITIGYNPIEYDPIYWNNLQNATLIHIDDDIANIDYYYQPDFEFIGDISLTLDRLLKKDIVLNIDLKSQEFLKKMQMELMIQDRVVISKQKKKLHPLQIIQQVQNMISDDTIVTCDIGSHGIWMARHFRSYEPRHLLFSNGMQTLGVALPWAIAAGLIYPNKKTISMSGDGGFLFSAMELETAVRLQSPIIHLVWNDGSYNMVAFQQEMKYGRSCATNLGDVDIVEHAKSYGAIGLRATSVDELVECLRTAYECKGPVVIDIPVDYSDNIKLGQTLQKGQLN